MELFEPADKHGKSIRAVNTGSTGGREVKNIRSTVCSIRPQVTLAFLLLNYLNLHINMETSLVL